MVLGHGKNKGNKHGILFECNDKYPMLLQWSFIVEGISSWRNNFYSSNRKHVVTQYNYLWDMMLRALVCSNFLMASTSCHWTCLDSVCNSKTSNSVQNCLSISTEIIPITAEIFANEQSPFLYRITFKNSSKIT